MTVSAAREAGYMLPSYCSDGFLIPYYDAKGQLIKGRWRWRNDPDARNGFAKHTKQPKYGQPSCIGCFVYLPHVEGMNWNKILAEPKLDLFIVEGELKALSLCLAGVPAVAVGGVWNFANQKRLLTELEQIARDGRSLYILFDSDAKDKPQVCGARYALTHALVNAGAKPAYIELPHLEDPESPEKTGADDYVRLHPKLRGDDLLNELRSHADEFAEVTELYNLNSRYVVDETTASIVRLFDANGVPANRQNECWKRSEFCAVIETQKVPIIRSDGKTKLAEISKLWMEWSECNRVVGRIYRPVSQTNSDFLYVYENGRRFLNNFCGWASSPRSNPSIVKDLWTPLIESHFRAQGPETAAETAARLRARKWFEQWWAYPIQHPGAKLMSAVVLSGYQGGGKDMLGRAVGQAVYGKHYRLIGPAELETTFNATFMEAVSLIHAQELTNKTNKKNFSELQKAWITSPSLYINEKNVKAYYTDTKFNFYMTTNPENSIQLDHDDRRYFIWRIPDARIQQLMGEKWVGDFHRALLETEEGRAALHHHLLYEVDCTDFDPNAEPPVTNAKQATQLFSTNEAESYVANFAAAQRETNPEGVWIVEDERRNTTFREKEFLNAFRRHFSPLGRSMVREFGKTTKAKRGLWVLKPSVDELKSKKFVTLAEAKERYERQKVKPKF